MIYAPIAGLEEFADWQLAVVNRSIGPTPAALTLYSREGAVLASSNLTLAANETREMNIQTLLPPGNAESKVGGLLFRSNIGNSRQLPSGPLQQGLHPGEGQLIITSSYRRGSRLIALMILLLAPMAILTQTTPAPTVPTAADARVAAIMDGILKRGEGHAEGREDVKTHTWVPPSPEDIAHIRELGPQAIGPLDKALDSPSRSFQRLLAVKLLGGIGGADVVPSLQRVLESSMPNSVRIAALSALGNVPDYLAAPILQKAAHDPDPQVAGCAKDLLTGYYHLPITQ
jgi:hypothetical protein